MSHINRLLGLGRSLAIYHGIPGRQRRLRQFYATFVSPGDLVFDIGAHVGNRTRAFAALASAAIVTLAILPVVVWRSAARPRVWVAMAVLSRALGLAAGLAGGHDLRVCLAPRSTPGGPGQSRSRSRCRRPAGPASDRGPGRTCAGDRP